MAKAAREDYERRLQKLEDFRYVMKLVATKTSIACAVLYFLIFKLRGIDNNIMSFKAVFHTIFVICAFLTSEALAFSSFNYSGTDGSPGEEYYTLSNGCPISNPQASLRIGNQLRSTLLLQDINLIELISHTTHERTIERLVHAKGAGAYGEFEVTHDITQYTSAAFLNTVGKKTPLFARYSTVGGEKGSADSVRDGRGFAFKFYTEEGNLDWLFFNLPVFFIRDPAKFPSLIHAQKRNPQTNLKDASMFWDYFNNNAEGYNTLMSLFSDKATPVSYRYADIFGINTYKFTKPDGSFHYVKIHLKTNQGVKNLTLAEAVTLSGTDPDSATRDLFESIAKGDYPSWTVYAQIIDPLAAENYTTNIFDATKTISQTDFPLIPFGKITLNKNPINFFAEVEQAAFQPSAIIPGWQVSPDPILQIRLFAYGSTQRHRLGSNFFQLPINRPLYNYNPTKRDGFNSIDGNYGALPNYIKSTFSPPIVTPAQVEQQAAHEQWVGTVVDFESQVVDADFVQPREQWAVLGQTPGQQDHFVGNVAASLSGAVEVVRDNTYAVFRRIDPDLGAQVQSATEALVSTSMKMKRKEEMEMNMKPRSVKGKSFREFMGTR